VKGYDPKYLNYLRQKAKIYEYKNEYSLLKDVLTDKDYAKWRESRSNSLTDKEDV
jgi:hypothetical protein